MFFDDLPISPILPILPILQKVMFHGDVTSPEGQFNIDRAGAEPSCLWTLARPSQEERHGVADASHGAEHQLIGSPQGLEVL